MHGRNHKHQNAAEKRRDALGPAAGQKPVFLTDHPDGVTLAVKVHPRAAKNEIGALTGTELRIKVTAPPVDSAANDALLRLLAAALDCPRRAVEIIRGQTSRQKVVKLHGMTPAMVLAKLKLS